MSLAQLSGNLPNALQSQLKEGQVTPFLGAGASSMVPRDSVHHPDATAPLAAAAREISTLLATDAARATLARFLAGLVHLDPRLCAPQPRLVPGLKELRCFQRDLLLVAFALTHDLLAAVLESGPLPLPGSGFCMSRKLAAETRTRVSALRTSASTLRGELTDPYLDGPKLPLGTIGSATVRYLDRHMPDASKEASLKQHHIEWLGQLLWFTLRYQLPLYPTSRELAFHIALEQLQVDAPPHELAAAFEASAMTILEPRLGTSERAKLTAIFAHCDKFTRSHPAAPASRLHTMLAIAMHRMYREFVSSRSAPFADRPPVPLVVTTNYDSAMEIALDRLAQPYCVVYPCTGDPRSGNGTATSHSSAQRTFTATAKGPWCAIMRTPDAWADEAGEDKTVLESSKILEFINSAGGPVVLKLHGSAKHAVLKAPYTSRIVAADSDYLVELLEPPDPSSSMGGIDGLLKSPGHPRHLWFLGYSLNDWNVRVRLYRDGRGSKGPNRFELHSVNRDTDLFRNAFMHRNGVRVHQMSLLEWTDVLQQAIESTGHLDDKERFALEGPQP